MTAALIILSIWVVGITCWIFKSNYQNDEVIDEDLEEEEMEYEDADTRSETMNIVSTAHEMFSNTDPMTASGVNRKKRVLNKCEKIANRVINEIYDEIFNEDAE